VGRPVATIEKTVSTRLNGDESVDAVVGRCRALASYGIEHAVFITDHAFSDDDVDTLAAAAAALADVEAAEVAP
jgi:electron transfer flavoprotein alpha/beta subunit